VADDFRIVSVRVLVIDGFSISERGSTPEGFRIAGDAKAPAHRVTRSPSTLLIPPYWDLDSDDTSIFDYHAVRDTPAANCQIGAIANTVPR
jgi:hypothetical protein